MITIVCVILLLKFKKLILFNLYDQFYPMNPEKKIFYNDNAIIITMIGIMIFKIGNYDLI